MHTIKTKPNAAKKSNNRVVDISVLRQSYKSYNEISNLKVKRMSFRNESINSTSCAYTCRISSFKRTFLEVFNY